MKVTGKSRRKNPMFEKDPDVLPFFSIHPKTKAGTIVRIALSVFCLIALILALLMRSGIMFMWFQKYTFLLYIVPLAGMVFLTCIAIYKRMKTPFLRIGIPGLILFFAFAVIMTLGGMMSYTTNLSLVPKMVIENDGKTVVIMRACAEPKGTEYVLNENGVEVPQYPVSVDAFVYTVRVPQAIEGVSYTIDGEIKVPNDENVQFEIKEEWVNDDSLRLYLAQDSSNVGTGEIIVTFKEGETTPASMEATEDMVYRNSFEKNGRKVNLYRSNGRITSTVNSHMMMRESDFEQVFFAYPRTMYMFVKLNTKTEGAIQVEPNGTLYAINWEWIEEGSVARLFPSEESTGATGSITIYFNETIDPQNVNSAATGGEAEPVSAE